jgi:hypothetical protein
MREIDVELELGEGGRVAPLLQDKLAGGQRRALFPGMIGMIVGLVVVPITGTMILYADARLLGGALGLRPGPGYWGVVTLVQIGAAVFGWEIGVQVGQRRHYQRYLGALAARGTPRRLLTRFAIAEDGLRVESDRASHLARWPTVLEIGGAETHWLIQTDTLTMALPKRAFASPDDERAFVAELLAHMTPAARERSTAAVKPAAG